MPAKVGHYLKVLLVTLQTNVCRINWSKYRHVCLKFIMHGIFYQSNTKRSKYMQEENVVIEKLETGPIKFGRF